MKLTFFGAARAVTGSCLCVECGGKKILVDCGLQQGRDERRSGDLGDPCQGEARRSAEEEHRRAVEAEYEQQFGGHCL